MCFKNFVIRFTIFKANFGKNIPIIVMATGIVLSKVPKIKIYIIPFFKMDGINITPIMANIEELK